MDHTFKSPKLNITSKKTFQKGAEFKFFRNVLYYLTGQSWSLYLLSEVMKFFFDLGFELMLCQLGFIYKIRQSSV